MEGGAGRPEEPSFHVWIDAQLPLSLALWLETELSVNALHLASLGVHAARDGEIVERAKLAGLPVVLITKDEGFAAFRLKWYGSAAGTPRTRSFVESF